MSYLSKHTGQEIDDKLDAVEVIQNTVSSINTSIKNIGIAVSDHDNLLKFAFTSNSNQAQEYARRLRTIIETPELAIAGLPMYIDTLLSRCALTDGSHYGEFSFQEDLAHNDELQVVTSVDRIILLAVPAFNAVIGGCDVQLVYAGTLFSDDWNTARRYYFNPVVLCNENCAEHVGLYIEYYKDSTEYKIGYSQLDADLTESIFDRFHAWAMEHPYDYKFF